MKIRKKFFIVLFNLTYFTILGVENNYLETSVVFFFSYYNDLSFSIEFVAVFKTTKSLVVGFSSAGGSKQLVIAFCKTSLWRILRGIQTYWIRVKWSSGDTCHECVKEELWQRCHLTATHSSVGKESAYNAGDPSLIPGSGICPGEWIGYPLQYSWPSIVAQLVKNLPIMLETQVRSLSWEDPLEKWKATHSIILTWRIPWTDSP